MSRARAYLERCIVNARVKAKNMRTISPSLQSVRIPYTDHSIIGIIEYFRADDTRELPRYGFRRFHEYITLPYAPAPGGG